MPGSVAAVGLLDASHPVEITGCRRAVNQAEQLESRLRRTCASLRWGVRLALPAPGWTRTLPAEVRELAVLQARAPCTRSAALREWQAIREHAAREGLSPLPVPALVMTARKTAESRPALLQAYRSAARDRGELHIIDDCNHESMLHAPQPAEHVADLIDIFVTRLSGRPSGHRTPRRRGKGPVDAATVR